MNCVDILFDWIYNNFDIENLFVFDKVNNCISLSNNYIINDINSYYLRLVMTPFYNQCYECILILEELKYKYMNHV